MDRVAVALFLGVLAMAGVAALIAGNGPGHLAVTALQAITLAVFILLVAFAIPARKRGPAVWAFLALQYAFVLANWFMLMAAYGDFTETGSTGYIAGFPTATFLMIAGTSFTALPLVALYVFGFRRFIFSHEDEARFEAIAGEARDAEAADERDGAA